jgi:tetratricopeptide (TPR) repeat protein
MLASKSKKKEDTSNSQLREGTEAFEKDFSEMDPEAEKWLSLGLEHQENDDFKEAIKCYKKAIIGGPNDKKAWNNIGLSYRFMGDFKNSKNALDKAIELDDEYVLAWENKGYLYTDANKLDEATEYLKKAISIDEEKASIWVGLGMIYFFQENFEEAIDSYERALEINPEDVMALNGEARTYHILSQQREERESIEMLERAVDYFERALNIDPNKSQIWNNYGVILGFLSRFTASLSAFDKAIFLSPEYGVAYFNKARIYIQKKDEKNAMEQLKMAIKKDSDLYNRAQMDFTLKKLTATEEFSKLTPRKKRKRKNK